MKKRILILAAVAVSGLAAVVASNTNKVAFADNPECKNAAGFYEAYGHYYCCVPNEYTENYCQGWNGPTWVSCSHSDRHLNE